MIQEAHSILVVVDLSDSARWRQVGALALFGLMRKCSLNFHLLRHSVDSLYHLPTTID